jgi:hypothetical protein
MLRGFVFRTRVRRLRLKAGMENKAAPPKAVPGLHFQVGVARKTKRSEGNPGFSLGSWQ